MHSPKRKYARPTVHLRRPYLVYGFVALIFVLILIAIRPGPDGSSWTSRPPPFRYDIGGWKVPESEQWPDTEHVCKLIDFSIFHANRTVGYIVVDGKVSLADARIGLPGLACVIIVNCMTTNRNEIKKTRFKTSIQNHIHPQLSASKPDPSTHAYQPVRDHAPDSLLVVAVSENVRHVIDVHPVRNHPNLYAAPAVFLHAGRYHLEIDVEYRNYAWNSEPDAPFPAYAPISTTSVNSIDVVASTPASIALLEKRLCGPGSDFRGRWLKLGFFRKLYPFDYWGVEDTHVDDKGYVFVPDRCRIEYFSLSQGNECLKDMVVHVYGDSNTMRSLKVISTANEWCAEGACDCEDRDGDDRSDTLFPWAANQDIPLQFNSSRNANTTVYFHFIEGLVRTSISTSTPWANLLKSSSPRARTLPKADLVLVTLGNWDSAFTPLEDFKRALSDFTRTLRRLYPKQRIVFQTPQPFCCTIMNEKHWTRERVQMFHDASVKKMREIGAVVWDVSVLGGRKDIVKRDDCENRNNYARIKMMRIQNQILWNVMCRKACDQKKFVVIISNLLKPVASPFLFILFILPSSPIPYSHSTTMTSQKLWGGRFTGANDPLMDAINVSVHFDRRLYGADILGSIAYSKALAKNHIISPSERDSLVTGLQQVLQEWDDNKFVLQPADEDIHTANERRLGEIVGSVAGKLHTGRSRNDQVATDMRIWVREEASKLLANLKELIAVAVNRAEREIDVLMPGYTHMQRAQPIRWSHLLLSYAWFWQNDADRLAQYIHRMNVLPLGSGALAGNPFDIDRDFLATELEFRGVVPNSLLGVSDRDFVAEFLFWASLVMIHVSRFAEDMIIYSTSEFGFVQLADTYRRSLRDTNDSIAIVTLPRPPADQSYLSNPPPPSTGSSLMPQKKNPDSLELLRGKSGRVFGQMSGFMMTYKGTPSTYNKDLQEDKEPVFDAVDTLSVSLQITAGVLSTLTIRPDKMRAGLSHDMLATDLAEYLVRKGVPFRETHHIAGAAVKLAEERGTSMAHLNLSDFQDLHPAFVDDVTEVWDFERSVEQRSTQGGTSEKSVRDQIEKLREWLKQGTKH
ncbi:L-Aspartase-like protein [Jimgerdemannia flammicorona]|uniref:argininosuccinate lyase n=1 Tax=Jimgerdemannia flammicorona TaxID=994334 RepID=A0A433D1F7_9FUNG|nr:L-Aspartase-like protein [Jimgerdemannia flammicorona]